MEPEPQAKTPEQLNEEARARAAAHETHVAGNAPLRTLYLLGGIALGVGLLIVGIATYQAGNAYDPTTALGWQALGGLLANAGGVLLVAALMVHAINWQIGLSARK